MTKQVTFSTPEAHSFSAPKEHIPTQADLDGASLVSLLHGAVEFGTKCKAEHLALFIEKANKLSKTEGFAGLHKVLTTAIENVTAQVSVIYSEEITALTDFAPLRGVATVLQKQKLLKLATGDEGDEMEFLELNKKFFLTLAENKHLSPMLYTINALEAHFNKSLLGKLELNAVFKEVSEAGLKHLPELVSSHIRSSYMMHHQKLTA